MGLRVSQGCSTCMACLVKHKVWGNVRKALL